MAFGMKETPHSLRLYFGLLGMWGLVRIFLSVESVYVKAKDPTAILSNPGVVIGLLIALGMACAYLYVAIALKDLLVVRPKVVVGVLVAGMALAGVAFGIQMRRQVTPSMVAGLVVQVLIFGYLLGNVRRIVHEQSE